MTYRRRTTTAELTARAVPFVQMMVMFPVLIVAAYWIKSALGIDLMEGHSFLHDWLYWG
ncbi:MAG: hypothetical protein K0U74_14110 [Alphaproteobacteria bacterium]|nr:hypothetical protein [Alphaproteobacteria bacterium]